MLSDLLSNVPLFLGFTTVAYSIAFVYYMISLSSDSPTKVNRAVMWVHFGFLLSTMSLAMTTFQTETFFPAANLSQALAFFAWSLAFVYLVPLARIQSDPFGVALTPFLTSLSLFAAMTYEKGTAATLEGHVLFVIHIVAAFFAYANFTISFSAAILYLLQNHQLKSKRSGRFYHKLPSLQELEKLVYEPMIWGVGLLLLSLVLGCFWSQHIYGELFFQDFKTWLTIANFIFYCVILFLRYRTALRAKRGAVLSLIAFIFVLFSFVGTRVLRGAHYVQ